MRDFYKRRALRLLPALIAVLLATTAYSLYDRDLLHIQLHSIVPVLFYVANRPTLVHGTLSPLLSHTWSLSIEEQFYLVWPLVVLVALSIRRSAPVVTCSIVAALTAITAYRISVVGRREVARRRPVLLGHLHPCRWAPRRCAGCSPLGSRTGTESLPRVGPVGEHGLPRRVCRLRDGPECLLLFRRFCAGRRGDVRGNTRGHRRNMETDARTHLGASAGDRTRVVRDLPLALPDIRGRPTQRGAVADGHPHSHWLDRDGDRRIDLMVRDRAPLLAMRRAHGASQHKDDKDTPKRSAPNRLEPIV